MGAWGLQRNAFHFGEVAGRAISRGTNVLDLFKHTDGCKCCEGLYEHFPLPSGERVHYYCPTKRVLDETPFPMEPCPSPPLCVSLTGLALPPLPQVVRFAALSSPSASCAPHTCAVRLYPITPSVRHASDPPRSLLPSCIADAAY